jgi:uncharacterized membrane protein
VDVLDTMMHWLGYGLCHQLPARSFFGAGHQVPVCARDEGIYLGFVVSLLVLAILSRGRRPAELPRWPVLALAGVFVGIMAWDGVTSYAGLRTTTNEIRLITGLLTGWALPVVLVPMLNGQLWRRPGTGRVPDGLASALLWLAPLPVVFVAIRWALPFLGIGYPMLVSAAIIVTFVSVNLAIVSLMPPFEGKADRLRQAWLAVVAAFGVTVVELALSTWLRTALIRWASTLR